jgi:hypothetical protein
MMRRGPFDQDSPDQPLGLSNSAKFDPSVLDRLLSGELVGPVTDSQPIAAKSRAVQANRVMRAFVRFLRDILSTSYGTSCQAPWLRQPGCRGPDTVGFVASSSRSTGVTDW